MLVIVINLHVYIKVASVTENCHSSENASEETCLGSEMPPITSTIPAFFQLTADEWTV